MESEISTKIKDVDNGKEIPTNALHQQNRSEEATIHDVHNISIEDLHPATKIDVAGCCKDRKDTFNLGLDTALINEQKTNAVETVEVARKKESFQTFHSHSLDCKVRLLLTNEKCESSTSTDGELCSSNERQNNLRLRKMNAYEECENDIMISMPTLRKLLNAKPCAFGTTHDVNGSTTSCNEELLVPMEEPQATFKNVKKKVSLYAMDIKRKVSAREFECIMREEVPDSTRKNNFNILDSSSLENDLEKRNDKSESPESYYRSDSEEKLDTTEAQELVEKCRKEISANLMQKFVDKLDMHGYAQFHEANGFRKVLWGIILAAMISIIFCVSHLSYRSENLHKQVIEFETEKVTEINFPTVTICNYGPVYTEDVYKRFQNIMEISEHQFKLFYYLMLSNRRELWREFDDINHEFKMFVLEKLRKKGFTSFKDILQLFEKHVKADINSDVINNMMFHSSQTSCVYENKDCSLDRDFNTVYRHKTQSLCKQFNSYEKHKPGLVSYGNDQENGLMMLWDISGRNYYYDNGLKGLMMEVHPYGTPHHLIDHRNTIYLEPGALTNIDLEEVTIKRLHPPYKPNCGELELKVVKGFPYSNAVCEVDCFVQKIIRKCGCACDQFAPFTGKVRICNVSEMTCTFEALVNEHCHECPVDCQGVEYKMSTSTLNIGNELMYNTISKTIKGWENKSDSEKEAYVNRNIVGFRIGFKSLEKQIQIYKESLLWYERLGMLGGIMSMLLGISIITGFDCLFFSFDYVYIALKSWCTQETLSRINSDK